MNSLNLGIYGSLELCWQGRTFFTGSTYQSSVRTELHPNYIDRIAL